MLAKDMPIGTRLTIPGERITLELAYGRKPWRQPVGRLRFSHAEVQESLNADEAQVISLGEHAVAAV